MKIFATFLTSVKTKVIDEELPIFVIFERHVNIFYENYVSLRFMDWIRAKCDQFCLDLETIRPKHASKKGTFYDANLNLFKKFQTHMTPIKIYSR